MAGFGRVLFHAREYWPGYMSCVLVVRQDLIDTRADAVSDHGRRRCPVRVVADDKVCVTMHNSHCTIMRARANPPTAGLPLLPKILPRIGVIRPVTWLPPDMDSMKNPR